MMPSRPGRGHPHSMMSTAKGILANFGIDGGKRQEDRMCLMISGGCMALLQALAMTLIPKRKCSICHL